LYPRVSLCCCQTETKKFTAWTDYADTHSSLTVCVGLSSACMALYVL